VFDAAMIQSILEVFRPTGSEIAYFAYAAEGWRAADPDDLKDATYFDIHVHRSYDADFAAAARGVACLRLTA
jgi:hypothetical protein